MGNSLGTPAQRAAVAATATGTVATATEPGPARPVANQGGSRWQPRRLIGFARRHWRGVAMATVVVVGAIIQLRGFVVARSLCCDELYIAVNLQRRSFSGLARMPLEYDQVAPLGWLWLERAAFRIGGHHEQVLRLPALLGGWATLVLLAMVSRRVLPGVAALVPVALAAGAPQLVYYSAQLKPYSLECASVLLLILLGLRAIDEPNWRRIAAFWLAGAVSMWFAVPAVFALAVIGAMVIGAMVIGATTRGAAVVGATRGRPTWLTVAWHGLAAIPAIAGGVVLYLVQGRHTASWIKPWWAKNWPTSFPPKPLSLGGALTWTRTTFPSFVELTLGAGRFQAAVAIVLGVGLVAIIVQSRFRAIIVIAPLVTAYGLALAWVYPFVQRTALWVAPVALLLLGAVVAVAGRVVRSTWLRIPSVVALLVLVGAAFVPTYGRIPTRSQLARSPLTREAITYVADSQRAGDLTLAYTNVGQVVRWYAPEVGLDWQGQFVFSKRSCRPDRALALVARASRIWVMLSPPPTREPSSFNDLLETMRRYGRPVAQRRFGTLLIMLYEVDPAPPPVPAATACLVLRPRDFYR